MANKQRFVYLDGMRGMAALCVGIMHGTQIYHLGWTPEHAILAVDFFFCLSGFVVAYAYDRKLADGMTSPDFILRRIIRLYPLIFLTVGLGGLLVILKALTNPSFPLGEAVVLVVTAMLLLPTGLMYGMESYPVNPPTWSLFFEIFINIFYVVFWRSISTRKSLVYLAVLGLGLAITTCIVGRVGLIGLATFRDFLFGFFRVGYPFLAGILIYRLSLHKTASRIQNWILPTVLILAVLLNGAYVNSVVFDLFAVLLAVPVIVMIGAGTATQSRRLNGIFEWLGAMSYPFYLIHNPMLRVFRQVYEHRTVFVGHPYLLPVVPLALSVLLSALFLKFYDVPVRAWLGRRVSAASGQMLPATSPLAVARDAAEDEMPAPSA